MNEQARVEAFREAVRRAGERYGVEAYAVAQPEQLGAVVQVRAALIFQPRADWTPPADEDEE